jgi:hypothetical protein
LVSFLIISNKHLTQPTTNKTNSVQDKHNNQQYNNQQDEHIKAHETKQQHEQVRVITGVVFLFSLALLSCSHEAVAPTSSTRHTTKGIHQSPTINRAEHTTLEMLPLVNKKRRIAASHVVPSKRKAKRHDHMSETVKTNAMQSILSNFFSPILTLSFPYDYTITDCRVQTPGHS